MTATARKIATLFYNTLRHGINYDADPGASYYGEDRISRPGSRQPPTPREVSRLHAARDAGVRVVSQGSPPRSPEDEIARENGVALRGDRGLVRLTKARVGQKNKITRRWAKRGTRPSAPKDQRTVSRLYLRRDLPQGRQGRSPRHAPMRHRGDEPAPGRNRHPDRAGRARRAARRSSWLAFLSGGLIVPPNITLIALPAKCPELNPQENIWQFMASENWLSNRVFKSFNDIVDRCCDAWNKLIDQPWRIMSIGIRDWAYRS